MPENNTQNYLPPSTREPGAKYLELIALRFGGINPDWLLTGRGEAFGAEVAEDPAIYQTSKKNSGNMVGSISGGKNKFTTLQDCETANANLRSENKMLRDQLDLQAKLIRLLEASQPKP